MQMKPASVQPQLECNLLVPGRRSPAKHARHKSMFNIDFDLGKGKTIQTIQDTNQLIY